MNKQPLSGSQFPSGDGAFPQSLCLPRGILRAGPPLEDSAGRAYSSGVSLSRPGGMRCKIVRLPAIL